MSYTPRSSLRSLRYASQKQNVRMHAQTEYICMKKVVMMKVRMMNDVEQMTLLTETNGLAACCPEL